MEYKTKEYYRNTIKYETELENIYDKTGISP